MYDGAHTDTIPETAECVHAPNKIRGIVANHHDARPDPRAELVMEPLEERAECRMRTGQSAQSYVLTGYKRRVRDLDRLIKREVGHCPHWCPTLCHRMVTHAGMYHAQPIRDVVIALRRRR